MTPLDKYGRMVLRLVLAAPDEARGYTGKRIAEDTGLHPAVVSVILNRAAERRLIYRGKGRKRWIRVTEAGHQWMSEPAPAADFDTTQRRERILRHLLHGAAWQNDLCTEAMIPRDAIGPILAAMTTEGLIGRRFDGHGLTDAGRQWLVSRGVQVDGPRPKVRICLMCRKRSKPGRWFCEFHLGRRSQMFRGNDDGSYCPSSGGMTL